MIHIATMLNTLVIHDAQQKRWLYFRDPQQIIAAHRIAEVIPALKVVEEMVSKRGLYAAGFIAYEAAPAFDSALAVEEDGLFPLVWFGLYRRPEQLSLPTTTASHQDLTRPWTSSLTRDAYEHAIKRIKRYIEAGDTYQVNFTLRLRSPFQGDPWSYFIALALAQDHRNSSFNSTVKRLSLAP
jgi:para-aminobenzoate synthetase/4-amino-4-deoxychorismate lyase